MNQCSIRISIQISGMLFNVFLKAKAPWLSLYAMYMCRYVVNFKPVLVPQATPSKCWHGSCRHEQTIKMDGDVHAPLELWYYRITDSWNRYDSCRASHFARGSVASLAPGPKHFAPRTCTKCISMTTMFVHTALLSSTRLYRSDQS